jgi:hypothetical protein
MIAEVWGIAAWWGVWAPIFGSAFVGLLVHYLTKDRDATTRQSILDREADVRRRQFRRHILKCSYTLERTRHDRPDNVWTAYAAMAPDILAEAELVAGDYPAEFEALIKRAGEWRREDAEAAR